MQKKEGKQGRREGVERGRKEGVELVMLECKAKHFTHIVHVNIFLYNLQVPMRCLLHCCCLLTTL